MAADDSHVVEHDSGHICYLYGAMLATPQGALGIPAFDNQRELVSIRDLISSSSENDNASSPSSSHNKDDQNV
jgi:hypothetical protein